MMIANDTSNAAMNYTNSGNAQIGAISDLLRECDRAIRFSEKEEVVLILGNTGSGKSTLTQFLAGNSRYLFSQETDEDSGDFIIVDLDNKISRNSTILSQTVFPDLFVDPETGVSYYDCPGFSDTRSAAHEIAATYFIKRIIDQAGSVKLVFVVNYNSLRVGMDRKDMLLLSQHVASFIKDMGKFNNSIALVATKVENTYLKKKLVPDEKIINSIGRFIENAKESVETNPQLLGDQSPEVRQRVIDFLDTLLYQDEDGQYARIGIFRRPERLGQLSEMDMYKNAEQSLKKMIAGFNYTSKSEEDFGYTISSDSKLYVNGLVDEIFKSISNQLAGLGNELIAHCTIQEATLHELEKLEQLFKTQYETLSKLQTNSIGNSTVDEFTEKFATYLHNLKIDFLRNYIKNINNEKAYIKFLYLVSNQSMENAGTSKLASGIANIVKYLDNTYKFYASLNNFYRVLSKYDVQKNKKLYNIGKVEKMSDIVESVLGQFVNETFQQFSDIRNIELNEPKLKSLNTVLTVALKQNNELTCTTEDRFTVKGHFVKLSDVDVNFCGGKNKFIDIFALDTVFIDTNIDLTGKEVQMAVGAPTWEVIGAQKLILDGKAGPDYIDLKGRRGDFYGQDGYGGLPGKPGGPGGSFVGIGERFINDNYLTISVNGGKGGTGQDGGDGANGADGTVCTTCFASKNSWTYIVYSNKQELLPGQPGGAGGNGGAGGYGGRAGSIRMLEIGGRRSAAVTSANEGARGSDGRGGEGGKGGRFYVNTEKSVVIVSLYSSVEGLNRFADSGRPGRDGAICECFGALQRSLTFTDPGTVKDQYMSYLRAHIGGHVKETNLKIFLDAIENNEMQDASKTRKRRFAGGIMYSGDISFQMDESDIPHERSLQQDDGEISDFNESSKYVGKLNNISHESDAADIGNPLLETETENSSRNSKKTFTQRSANTGAYVTSGASDLYKNSFLNSVFSFFSEGVASVASMGVIFDNYKNYLGQEICSFSSNTLLPSGTPENNISPVPLKPPHINGFGDMSLSLHEHFALTYSQNNLLLWDLVVKKLSGRSRRRTGNRSNIERDRFASDLPYRHYAPRND